MLPQLRLTSVLWMFLISLHLGESFFILPNLNFLTEPIVPHAKAKRSIGTQSVSNDKKQCSDAEIQDLQSDLTVCLKEPIIKALQKNRRRRK